jgi:hypothetical protein
VKNYQILTIIGSSLGIYGQFYDKYYGTASSVAVIALSILSMICVLLFERRFKLLGIILIVTGLIAFHMAGGFGVLEMPLLVASGIIVFNKKSSEFEGLKLKHTKIE